jgi:SAM-dependent methyltransferase
MVSLARENLKDFDSVFEVGGVSALREQGEESLDIVVSTNVLGYLSPEDERDFFLGAARVLRPGGHVLLTLGNELFDLFALNSGTASFFEKHFSVIGSTKLLIQGDKPRLGNARRHNPLSIEAEVEEFGFTREEFAFSQWHHVPPILEEVDKDKEKNEARLSSRDHDFDANSLSRIERWKALFQCSIFGVLLRKS